MNPKQARFVDEYLIDRNASQAAIRAGYRGKANVVGPRLLSVVSIRQEIDRRSALQLASTELSAARVLEEIRRLAMSDVRGFFDDVGNLKPLKDLTAEQGSALASFEVIKKNAAAGDGVVDTIHKIRVWDKPKALEMLAKHFALLTERVEHSGGLDIVWKDSE